MSFRSSLRPLLVALLGVVTGVTVHAQAADPLLPTTTAMTGVVASIFYGQVIGDTAVGQVHSTDSASFNGGIYTFYIDGATVCTLPVDGDQHICPVGTGAGYPAGAHTLTAMYSGNQFYLAPLLRLIW